MYIKCIHIYNINFNSMKNINLPKTQQIYINIVQNSFN